MADERLQQLARDLAPLLATEFLSLRSGYEFSTFTPALAGVGTAGTFTYDTGNTGGLYIRVGNAIQFSGRVRITAIGVAPVGLMTITGLPRSAYATGAGGVMGQCTLALWTGFNLAAGYTQVTGVITSTESRVQLYKSGSNVAVAGVTGAETLLIGGVIDLLFSGTYISS